MASTAEVNTVLSEDLEQLSNPPSRVPSYKRVLRVPTIVSISTTIGSTSTNFLSNVSNFGASVLSLRRTATVSTRATSIHSDDKTNFGLLSDPSTGNVSNGALADTDKSNISKVSTALVYAISGELSPSAIINCAARWYIDLLERKCKEAWIHIIGPVLEPGDPLATGATDVNLCKAFRIFRTVVLTVRNDKDIALSNLVDAVYNEEKWDFVDEDRWHAEVLVFTAFGWLTMLYTPTSFSDPKSLQILGPESLASPKSKFFGFPGRHKPESKTFSCLQQDLQYVDRPLSELLGNFGHILPEFQQYPTSGIPASTGSHKPVQECSEYIEVPKVCFYTLHHFAKIKIQWVDCLSLHLEYDSHRKVLRLFRFPSLCLLMCYSDKSFLSRFFFELATDKEDADVDKNYAHDFYKEVLLSYRLIFAEARCSHAIYNTLKSQWPHLSQEDHDPLLDVICGQSWKDGDSREIWGEIDAGYPVHRYSTSDTFRFLGPRLIILQDAAGGHEPDGIWPLWYDKRDTLRWWTFWVHETCSSG